MLGEASKTACKAGRLWQGWRLLEACTARKACARPCRNLQYCFSQELAGATPWRCPLDTPCLLLCAAHCQACFAVRVEQEPARSPGVTPGSTM